MEGDFHAPPPMYTASEMAERLAAERARIRRELKAAFADCFSTQRDLNAEKVIAALDRIIPEVE